MAKLTTTYSGFFSSAISQHFKKCDRIIVNTNTETGTFTATDGYIVIRSIGLDYDGTIRPALQKDPADGTYQRDGKTWTRTGDAPKKGLDSFLDPGLNVSVSLPAPFALDLDENKTVRGYYNPDTKEIAYFSAEYIKFFPEAADHLLTTGKTGIAVLGRDRRFYAGLLPIRVNNPAFDRAVRAYFEKEPADVEKVREELELTTKERDKARRERDEQLDRVKVLEAQLEDAARIAKEERAEEAAPAESKPALNTAAFEKLDGVTVIIKGAATNKPIAWISGETKKHAETLKKAGCKWSVKKSAWYLTA